MIESLPLIFCIFTLLFIFFGKAVIKSDVHNSFVFAVLLSLSIHAPYISTPVSLGWEWLEALPWAVFLIYCSEQRIKDYFEKGK